MLLRAAIFILVMFNYIQYAPAAEKPILLNSDYSKPIHISGDNTRLNITTDISQPPSVRVLDHGGGSSCHIEVIIEEEKINHSISFINKGKRWFHFWPFLFKCDPEVAINLPSEKKVQIMFDVATVNMDGRYEEVDIRSDVTTIDMDGQYEKVNIDSNVTTIDMDGRYEEVDIRSDVVTVRTFFKDTQSDDKVSIISDVLIANLGFSENSKIYYSIEANVSTFLKTIRSSSYEDSAKVTIQTNVLNGSIFVNK